MEVIYTGLRQTPEMIVNSLLQEDVDVIGLSILSGAHNAIVPRVSELLRQNKMDDVLLLVGGIIPEQDFDLMKKAGVTGIFNPGTPMDEIVEFIREKRQSTRRGSLSRNVHLKFKENHRESHILEFSPMTKLEEILAATRARVAAQKERQTYTRLRRPQRPISHAVSASVCTPWLSLARLCIAEFRKLRHPRACCGKLFQWGY